MDRLNGKTILIGRDPGVSNLLIAIKGIGKTSALGSPASVPYSVSRCRVAEGTAHAKIEISDKGDMTLYNMNPSNSTFVDGVEIAICRITPKSRIELGNDRFMLQPSSLLEAAKKLIPALPVDISHLKEVWENYEAENAEIAKRQQELGKKRMLPIMVSSASGIVSGVVACVATVSTLWVTLPITGVVSALYFRNYKTKDTSYEDKQKVLNEFQQKYVCPECHHYFNAMSYALLKNQLRNPKDGKMYCPRCKCEFIEKK